MKISHVSLPMILSSKKFSFIHLYCFQKLTINAKHWNLCSSANCCKTQHYDTFWYPNSLLTISWTTEFGRWSYTAIAQLSWIKTSIYTLSSAVDKYGHPTWVFSYNLVHSIVNLLHQANTYFLHVMCLSYTATCSEWISVGFLPLAKKSYYTLPLRLCLYLPTSSSFIFNNIFLYS